MNCTALFWCNSTLNQARPRPLPLCFRITFTSACDKKGRRSRKGRGKPSEVAVPKATAGVEVQRGRPPPAPEETASLPPSLFSGPLRSIRHKFLCAAAPSTIWPFLGKNYACASEFALTSLTRSHFECCAAALLHRGVRYLIFSIPSRPLRPLSALHWPFGHCAMTLDVKPFSEKVKVSRASRYDQGYLVTLIARQSLSSPSRQKRK